MPVSFQQDIADFCAKTGLKGATVIKKLAFDAFAGLMLRTPVDTGRARANWRISINKIDATVEPERKTASALKGKGGAGVGYSFNTGYSGSHPPSGGESSKASAALGPVVWGDVVYISNTLPYIEALENGHSKQAPSGMLRVTFLEVQSNFAAAVASVK